MDASLYLLFGRARASVLKVLHEAVEHGVPLHLREIARRSGVSATAVQYELRLLRQLGIVQDIGTDSRPLYVLDRRHNLFSDLHGIFSRPGESGVSADDAHFARKRVQQRRDRGKKSQQNSAFLEQWGTLAGKVRVG
jgi:DNA-binding Lrp family transcriptional regulator